MLQDLRFGLRQLRKSPGFALTAIATLALGIGANTAIFSVVNAVLLKPLPYPDADRIMFVEDGDRTDPAAPRFAVSWPDYQDWKRDNTVFEELAVARHETYPVSNLPDRAPEQVSGAIVTANFFKVIGVQPQLGRVFTEEEDKPNAPQLAVISDRLWSRLFQRDPNVLGRVVTFYSRPATIVGVMPPEMQSPADTDVWFGLVRRTAFGGWENRGIHPMLFAWGKLKPGVSTERAQAEFRAIAARIEKDHPDTNTNLTAVATPLLESMVGKYRTNLALLLGAVGLVLLIACANLANLFAARSAARMREFAIREAIGASRAQIVRQLLIESSVVAVIGGACGLLLAIWSRDLLAIVAPKNLERFQTIAFDWRVLLFTFLLGTLTSVLFGIWPAWQSARVDIRTNLQAGAHGSSDAPSAKRTRDWLVIADISLTLVLLTSAGLVLKSFARLQALDLGFDPHHLQTTKIDLPFPNYRDYKQAVAFGKTLLEQVNATPGVERATLGSNPPMTSGWQIGFVPEGSNIQPGQEPNADSEVVSGDYLGTLKTSLLRGRAFDEHDTKESPLVCMIDHALADRFFPGQDALGKRLSADPDGNGNENKMYQIVGVVSRVRFHGASEAENLPVIYFPHAQVQRLNFVLIARTTMNTAAFEQNVKRIVTALDPRQPIYDTRSMESRVAETWSTQRLLTFLLSVFAGLALVLATIGLYGVIAYNAVRRLREIGVRLALGAQRSDIHALIVTHGVRLLAIGLALGLAGSLLSSRLIAGVLFQTAPLDVLTYSSVCAVLAFATLVACWLPARRAARIDPIITLRAE